MKAILHKRFEEQYRKLPTKQRDKVKRTIEVFLEDPENPVLRNHPLKGEWFKYRSISAGGDLRIHYRIISEDTVMFVAVGTHSQLYK